MELKATEVRKAQQAKTAQMELTQEPITTMETATITAIITAHLSLPVAVALTPQHHQVKIATMPQARAAAVLIFQILQAAITPVQETAAAALTLQNRQTAATAVSRIITAAAASIRKEKTKLWE